jgi:hypothetical protein
MLLFSCSLWYPSNFILVVHNHQPSHHSPLSETFPAPILDLLDVTNIRLSLLTAAHCPINSADSSSLIRLSLMLFATYALLYVPPSIMRYLHPHRSNSCKWPRLGVTRCSLSSTLESPKTDLSAEVLLCSETVFVRMERIW